MTTTKLCPNCTRTKSLTDFCVRKKSKDGRQPWCKICTTDHFKGYYKKNPKAYRVRAAKVQQEAAEIVKALKDNKPCTDCGVRYPFYVMSYDHLDASTKIDTISALYASGKAKVLEEIQKCELVCLNCHAVRTYKRATSP